MMTKGPSYANFLKRESLRELYRRFKEEPEFTRYYWNCDFTDVIDESKDSLLSNIQFDFLAFDLEIPEEGDLKDGENAICLHSQLELDRVAASDLRLWAYLTHMIYPDYTKKRWLNYGRKPIEEKFFGTELNVWTDNKDIKTWESMKASIESRFFFTNLNSNIETLNRNSIARLWWGAYLTFDEKRNPEDPYELTRVLFSVQSLQQALLERSLGSNPLIRKAVLEFFLEHPEFRKDKPSQRILKYVNLLAGPKVLSLVDKNKIRDKLIEFAKVLDEDHELELEDQE